LNGTSPKFYVQDSNGVKWLVKLGVEARPETAATRLVWAAGYFTDEDYFLPQIHVKSLPKLRREMFGASPETGIVPNVRLKRESEGWWQVDGHFALPPPRNLEDASEATDQFGRAPCHGPAGRGNWVKVPSLSEMCP